MGTHFYRERRITINEARDRELRKTLREIYAQVTSTVAS